MTEDIGREIGSKIGKVLEVDKRAIQADQAKFLRLRVKMQLDKPLWRGGGMLKMMKVEDFGLVSGMRDYLLSAIYVESLGMMKNIVKLVPWSNYQEGNMVNG